LIPLSVNTTGDGRICPKEKECFNLNEAIKKEENRVKNSEKSIFQKEELTEGRGVIFIFN